MLMRRQALLSAAVLGTAAGVLSLTGADGPVSLWNEPGNESRAAPGDAAPHVPPRQCDVAYVSWSGGEPFGKYGNVHALDDVFGANQWKRLDFPTAVSEGLWNYRMILMDGSAQGDGQFIAFVNTHRTEMENWVAAGGSLIINAARWDELDDFDLGFGITLVHRFSEHGYAQDPLHPVFDGPYGFTGGWFEGDPLTRDSITGDDLICLMTGDGGGCALAERSWGGGHVLAGGLTLPYFGEDNSWSPNCAVLHRNLLAYAFDMIGEEGIKHRQPADDTSVTAYFSNANSNWSPWLRYDDFICHHTGEINRVTFWGLISEDASSPLENVAAFGIVFFPWLAGGPCDFLPGSPLCYYEIPAADVSHQFAFLTWDAAVYKYSVNLPEPCWQEHGEHYVLLIAAILEDPDGPCVFLWWPSSVQWGTEAASYDRVNDDWSCVLADDQAFELYSEPGEPYAPEVLLYDVDFDLPPHYPGSPPATGDGPAPRDTVTEIIFGEPLVVEALGALVQQPCAFGDHPTDPYEQFYFSTEKGGLHGFPHVYPAYRARLDVLIINDVTFNVYMDCSTAHHVKFDSFEKIRAVVLGDEPYDVEIGTFEHGVPVSLEIETDIEAQTWRILLDNREAFVGPYPSEQLEGLRLSLHTDLPEDPVAVDNIMIWGIGEPCPADFDGDGDVDTADLLFLLGCWGVPCGDVDGDGDTDTADLLALLAAWGECP